MKFIIDEEACKKHNLTINEVLGILFCRTTDNVYETLEDMTTKEYITHGAYPTPHWNDEVDSILCESDNVIPTKERCSALADRLKELFPKGIKSGNAAWRGNNRELTLRLQKFFKLYGNKWSDDEIVDATRKYVEHFNGNYTYMRILKYFIMKSVSKIDEEGLAHIEDISELATWLENGESMVTDTDDWLSEMR